MSIDYNHKESPSHVVVKRTSINELNQKIHLKKFISREFFRATLLPLLILGVTLLALYFFMNAYILGNSVDTLREDRFSHLMEITESQARNIDKQLDGISALASVLRAETTRFFQYPELFPTLEAESLFQYAPSGVLYKPENDGGSSLFYSNLHPVGEREKEKAMQSETLDPLYKVLYESNKNIVAVYFNTFDSMARYYPFVEDIHKQLPPDIEIPTYNFYYLADKEHNPKGRTVWTEAYLDPMGKGWMMSCIVPIYRNDFLEGVAGIDITTQKFVDNILSLELPWRAGALLVDSKGTIMAMPPKIEHILGVHELDGYKYQGKVQQDTHKPQSFNLLESVLSKIRQPVSELIEKPGGFITFSLNGGQYVLCQHTISTTGWKLMVLAEEADILHPITRLENRSRLIGYVATGFMCLFSLFFFFFLLGNTRKMTDRIARPINVLANATHGLSAGNYQMEMESSGVNELDQLSRDFQIMTVDLKKLHDDLTDQINNANAAEKAANKAKEALAEHKSALEQTIAERTSELTVANRTLEDDINKRKQVEKVLDSERRQLLSIYDSIDEIIYISRPDTYELLYVNEAFRKIWPDSIGKKCFQVLQNLKEPCPFCTNSIIFGEKMGQVHIWEHCNLDTGRWYRCIDKAIQWPDGQMVRYEMAIDTTEQKTAENELRKSENKYKNIFNSLIDIYIESDMSGKIIEISPSFEKHSGYRREDAIGKYAGDFYADPNQREELINRLTTDGYVDDLEMDFIHKDGHVVPLSVNSTFQKDDQGNPIKLVGMLRNVSEQKKAQKTILESEKRYHSIMEASPDPIVIYDMEGKTVYINPAFTRVFGWTLEEMCGHKIDYIPDEAFSETQNMLKRLKQGESYSGFKTKRYDKNRNLIDIDMSFSVWKDEFGKPGGSVVILRDVTEHNKVLDQLRKAQKLEAIGNLAGGIAHDFNNILSGIFGYSQLAEIHLNTPERARNDIEQIQKAGRKAMELVQQILTISRKSEPKKDPVQIYLILNEAIKLLRATIPTSIEIKGDLQSQAHVMADAAKIHQVIMNLGTNAYHAMMEQEGILSVTLKEILIGKQDAPSLELKPGRYLRLDVSDTGCGMDSKTVEKIFDPYFTTKEHGKGTGLGLAVTYGIIQEHKGAINVYSELGQGTTFKVYFPILDKKTIAESVLVEDAQPLTGSEELLLVDDDETVLFATQDLLRELGYTVHSFNNGKDALETYALNQNQFDLVITDLTMPGMNGFELSKRILELCPDQPVVLCTGLGESIIKEKANAIGIAAFVEKPMITWEIAKTIRSILN